MFKKILFAIIIPSSLITCNNDDNNMAGGACTYDEKILPALLITLEKIDSIHYDAIFIMGSNRSMEGNDTIRYSHFERGRYLTSDEIMMDSITIGRKYQYIIQKIKTGSCNPNVDMLVLKPYVEK
jgi:hypothetical protein